jgi:hypothetical protein
VVVVVGWAVVVVGPAVVVVVVVGPAVVVVVVVGPAVVVVVVVAPAVVVVVVVVWCVVILAAAACIKASMLKSAIVKDTKTGATKAPVPINLFSVDLLSESSPSRAPLKSCPSSLINAPPVQSICKVCEETLAHYKVLSLPGFIRPRPAPG